MFNKFNYIFIISLVCLYTVNAQNVISIEEIIQQFNDSSYRLQVDQQLISQAKIQNTAGYAGNLPQLSMSGQGQAEINSTRLEFFDGRFRSADNAANYSAGGSLDLLYPVYEAGAKEARKKLLENSLENAENSYRLNLQDRLLQLLLISSEYNYLSEQENIYQRDTTYWGQLLEIRKNILDIGRGNKVDLIQIESERNASLTQLKRANQQKEVAKIQLSAIAFMDQEFDSIKIRPFLDRQMMENAARPQALVEREKIQMREASLALSLAESLQYPVISAFAGYGYNWSRNAVGILLSNQNFGPYAGLQLNWNLYSGQQAKIDIQSSKIRQRSAQLELKAVERELAFQELELQRALQIQEEIVQQEILQKELLQEQFGLVQERYKEGKINFLEVLDYQRRVLLNRLNLAQARFQIRNYEIRLLYIKGQLGV